MTVRVHIERLVLDGLPIERREGVAVQAAVEAELTRLLAEGGIAAALRSGGALPGVHGGAITLAHAAQPTGIGQQIAQSVYAAMGAPRFPSGVIHKQE
jgi:hypothetical protein